MKRINNLKQQIESIYGENAPYILSDNIQDLHFLERKIEESLGTEEDNDFIDFCIRQLLERAESSNERLLTPATAKVGDGVTLRFYSDSEACTIIKKTKCSITIRRDKATLDKSFKPEFVPGGFSAVCTNQENQKYTYEADPDGMTYTLRWSNKNNCYQYNGSRATKGRHEFYDYNF